MVEMELYRIRMDDRGAEQLIVLREKGGRRLLHIVIGIFEADAIKMQVAGVKLPRPLTHDLLRNVIEGLGAHLDRIVIDKLAENTFFAKLVITQKDGEVVQIDSRPSDAIALALRADAPIFVEEEVLDMAGTYM